jgi:myosin heavy subunit
MSETKSVNFRLPLNLVESLKTQAQAQNTTQQALLSLFIQEGLKERDDSSIPQDCLSVPHSLLDKLATDNQVILDRIDTLEDYFSDYLSKDSQSLSKRVEILEKASAHLARQQAAINSCLDKHLDLSEKLKKADSFLSALQTKISNLDGKLSLLQEQVEQLLNANVLATPNPPTELVSSASETITNNIELLSRIAVLEPELVHLEQERQPLPPSDKLSTQLALPSVERLAQQLTSSSQLEQASTGLTETSSSDLSSLEERLPQYQHSREPIAQLENASPSSEITTSFADDETAGIEQGWIGASSAYEYAQRQGYEGKKEAFRMLSKSRSPDAAYAQWNLKMDLHRRGRRGQKSKWLLPIDPEHYRQLMGNASAATDD